MAVSGHAGKLPIANPCLFTCLDKITYLEIAFFVRANTTTKYSPVVYACLIFNSYKKLEGASFMGERRKLFETERGKKKKTSIVVRDTSVTGGAVWKICIFHELSLTSLNNSAHFLWRTQNSPHSLPLSVCLNTSAQMYYVINAYGKTLDFPCVRLSDSCVGSQVNSSSFTLSLFNSMEHFESLLSAIYCSDIIYR